MMPSSNRVEKNLPTSNKLKHGWQALQLNALSATDKLNFQKLRPAIPAQKPNQPRLWLACACQRWSRKPHVQFLRLNSGSLSQLLLGTSLASVGRGRRSRFFK
jgi:hypothetical protein